MASWWLHHRSPHVVQTLPGKGQKASYRQERKIYIAAVWEVGIWLLGNRILGNHCSSLLKSTESGSIQWNKANSLQFPWRGSVGMNRMLLPPLPSSTPEDLAPFCQLSLAVPIWHITMEDQTPVCSPAHPGGVRYSNAKNTPSQNNPSQLSPRQVWNICGCPEKQTDPWLLSKKSKTHF